LGLKNNPPIDEYGFRERLDAIIDMDHCLIGLSGMAPWATFDEAFGKHYNPDFPCAPFI